MTIPNDITLLASGEPSSMFHVAHDKMHGTWWVFTSADNFGPHPFYEDATASAFSLARATQVSDEGRVCIWARNHVEYRLYTALGRGITFGIRLDT
jgi:hypothetical protein